MRFRESLTSKFTWALCDRVLCGVFLVAMMALRISAVPLWVVTVPRGTHPSVWSSSFDPVGDVWVDARHVRYLWPGVYHAALTFHDPWVHWGDRCIARDHQIIPLPCPYELPLRLDMRQRQPVPVMFNLLDEIDRYRQGASVELKVASGGTVTVHWRGVQLVLGRRHLLERFARAKDILFQPAWQTAQGRMDMRYPDGFAWRAQVSAQSAASLGSDSLR